MYVKVCGLRRAQDVEACLSAGVDAIGLNFVPSSKRYIAPPDAAKLVAAFGSRVEWVGVTADLAANDARELFSAVGLDWLQLHGSETPSDLVRLGVPAFKALGIAGPADVARADEYSGPRLLVDAKVEGALGGTGQVFDWQLVSALAAARQTILAGGLSPDNVAAAISRVSPWGVDVASGVESADAYKDPDRVAAFVRAARS